MNRAWSIRAQLLIWLLPLLIGLRLISGFVVVHLTKDSITRVYDASLENAAGAIASHVTVTPLGLKFGLPDTAERMLRSSVDEKLYYQVLGPNNQLLGGNADLPAIAPAVDSFTTLDINDEAVRFVSRQFSMGHSSSAADGEAVPKVTVRIAETMAKRAESTAESVFHILIQQLIAMLGLIVVVWFGVGRSIRPVTAIQREIERRSGVDYRPVDVNPVPTEIRPLITTINSLLARVGADIEAQRRFASNAAHQLRTPLAGVRAHAEYIKQSTSLDSVRESVEELLEGTDRCVHLVKQLLAISRVEPGAQGHATFSPIDLSLIAKECCRLQLAAAAKKQIDLGYEGPNSGIILNGNATCMQELILNLIDNAIRYSPGGATVTVRLLVESGDVTLEVEDTGPGIPEAERNKVFERFYRVLGTNQDGSGLGLAIVNEVASLHGAEVFLKTPTSGAGLIVTVHFPRVKKTKISPQAFLA